MSFKNNIQEVLVIMRYIPRLPESETFAQVRTYLQARGFKNGFLLLVIIIIVFGFIYNWRNGSLDRFLCTKKISKGNSKDENEPAEDTGNDHHDISHTHQFILSIINIEFIKIERHEA